MRSTVSWATYRDTRRRRRAGGPALLARAWLDRHREIRAARPAVAANPAAKRCGMVRGTGRIHARERDDDAAEGSHEHARDRLLGYLCLRAGTRRSRRREIRFVVSSSRTSADDERWVVPIRVRRPGRANQVVDLLPDAHGSGEPRPRRSSKAPTRSTTTRRRKIETDRPVPEVVVGQTAARLPRRRRCARSVLGSPGQSVETRVGCQPLGDLPAASREEPQSSSGNATMSELTWSSLRCARPRDPARIAGEGARGRVRRRPLARRLSLVLVDDDHTQLPNPLRLD